MKKLMPALLAVLFTLPAHAQSNLYSGTNSVAIGTTVPTTGTTLDLGSNTNSMLLPVGTDGQRPTGVNGMLRYNTTTPAVEGYINNAWTSLSTGGGGFSSCTQVTGTGTDSASATCSGGYTLTGGGCAIGSCSSGITGASTYPSSSTTWQCAYSGCTLTAYAICCH